MLSKSDLFYTHHKQRIIITNLYHMPVTNTWFLHYNSMTLCELNGSYNYSFIKSYTKAVFSVGMTTNQSFVQE